MFKENKIATKNYVFSSTTQVLQQHLTALFSNSGTYTASHTLLIFEPHNYSVNVQPDAGLRTAATACFQGGLYT